MYDLLALCLLCRSLEEQAPTKPSFCMHHDWPERTEPLITRASLDYATDSSAEIWEAHQIRRNPKIATCELFELQES